MLHSKGWQGGQKNHRAIIIVGALLALNISACRQSHAETPADETAQKTLQLYRKHALDAQQQLDIIIDQSDDSTFADRFVNSYYQQGGRWLWMNNPDQLELGDALDSLLHAELPAMGFSEEHFSLSDIDNGLKAMRNPEQVDGLPVTMAQMENRLTKAYLHYAVGQRFGFTTPKRLFGKSNYDITTEEADTAFVVRAIRQLRTKQRMLDFLQAAAPTDKAYNRLKEQLAKDSTPDKRNRILCNMERLRWRDAKHAKEAERYVFVNIASQQMWAIAPDSVINMRICCGKPATKTPLLSSEISRIELNPEWGIPQSIIRGEVSHHAGDSAYFARRNYYVTNSAGQRVNPARLSSSELGSGRYAVRQRSGAGNSLGRIIFRFPNKFSVYLHHTSSPGAFNRDVRTISHGCVRLQRPFEIAEFVLPNADEWMLDKMRLSIDMPPKTEKGREYKQQHEGAIRLVNNVSVDPKVPVLIDYYTLYPNPKTGELDTWGDPYGYDPIVLKAIKPFLR